MFTAENVKQEFERLIKLKFGDGAKIKIGTDRTCTLIDRYPPNYVIRFGRENLDARYSAYEQTNDESRYQKMVDKFKDYLDRIKPDREEKMKAAFTPEPTKKRKMTCICGKRATDTIKIKEDYIFPYCGQIDCELTWGDAIYLLLGQDKNSFNAEPS